MSICGPVGLCSGMAVAGRDDAAIVEGKNFVEVIGMSRENEYVCSENLSEVLIGAWIFSRFVIGTIGTSGSGCAAREGWGVESSTALGAKKLSRLRRKDMRSRKLTDDLMDMLSAARFLDFLVSRILRVWIFQALCSL